MNYKSFLLAIWIFISFIPMLVASIVYGWIVIPLTERPAENQSWDDFVTEKGCWLADHQAAITIVFYLVVILLSL